MVSPAGGDETTSAPADGSDTEAAGQSDQRRPGRDSPPSTGRVPVPAVVDNGAGFLLALLVWGWVGLPLLRGGPAEVKKVLLAKFFNKDAQGRWLP